MNTGSSRQTSEKYREEKNKESLIFSTMSIDIYLTVVDNLWDMGLALELIYSLRNMGSTGYISLYTNQVETTKGFFQKSAPFLQNISICEVSESKYSETRVTISLFHTEIPDFIKKMKRLILRVDYLSFDPEWIKMTWKEHAFSTKETQIIEIVPSFLRGGAGILEHTFPENTREKWLQKKNLPQVLREKKWLSLFIYNATLDRLVFDISDDWIVFILGRNEIKWNNSNASIVFPGFLQVDEYYELFHLTDTNIIRGDGSIVQAFNSEKPFLWDIYKEIGGFPESISEQFLEFLKPTPPYTNLHNDFNTGKKEISLRDTLKILSEEWEKHTFQKKEGSPILVETLKKYIDSFDFFI